MVPPLQGPLEQPFCTSHAVPSVREVPATSQHYHKPCFEVHGGLKVGSKCPFAVLLIAAGRKKQQKVPPAAGSCILAQRAYGLRFGFKASVFRV